MASEITAKDKALAKLCLECPVCRHARKKQRGIAYTIVKHVEAGLCPACKAYAKVYGRKAYESMA